MATHTLRRFESVPHLTRWLAVGFISGAFAVFGRAHARGLRRF